MPLTCATCGRANREDARFCDQCGSSLEAAARATETRKVLTVVFADLVSSTRLQASLDAESARRVMNRFYGAMRGVVERHQGRLERLVGDAVVASFGAEKLREDDAVRAVTAGRAMQDALELLNGELLDTWGVRLQMRVGVNTGELVVGARGELVGDMMNTAARLEQAAPVGEVLIGQATWRLVRHAIRVESAGALELKGKDEPVPAWRVVSTDLDAERLSSLVQAPLVDRRSELQRLGSHLDEVLVEQACRLVTVVGSPGVGKSRLARELARLADPRFRVIQSRCEPSGEQITFLPIIEILRALAGIDAGDPLEAVLDKLALLVPGDEAHGERLRTAIAGVLGVGEPRPLQETFWALRRVLTAAASTVPLLLVLDDVHLAQPVLLDLLEHLVEWIREAPILVLALARPELRDSREGLASAGPPVAAVIELEPLDRASSNELVAGLLGELQAPAGFRERILERTEGNPLFLGETVRMLVEEGLMRPEGDAWVLAVSELASLDVPPTIQALLAARIERLPAAERAVVERAAVIGNEFYRGAVLELLNPRPQNGIDAQLEALWRKDMVTPQGIEWMGEAVYRFQHVLIRDAAYRSLLKETRAELHERFANWLESKAENLPDDYEETIGFHLEQAHEYLRQLGPVGERGRALSSRAVKRLMSAGRRALAREDLAAADNLLSRAHERDPDLREEVLWDLCETVLSAGEAPRGAELARRYAAAAADPVWSARALVLRAQLGDLTGEREVAATARAAAIELRELGDRAGEAKAWHVAARGYARLGQVRAVEESLDRALAAARACADKRRILAVLADAPRAALWGPTSVVRASGRCLDLVRMLRATSPNRQVEAVAMRCQAVLEAMRADAATARKILAASRAALAELGLKLELYQTDVHAGMVELLAGDPAGAARHLQSARTGFEALGVRSGAAEAAALTATALVAQGEHDKQALAETEFAEEHCGDDLKTTITWCGARAEVLARSGELDEALVVGRRAVTLAEPTDALADKGDAAISLARVLAVAGRHDQMREAVGSALEFYEAKGHLVGVGWATALRGDTASTQRGPGSARGRETKPKEPSGERVTEADRVTTAYVAALNSRDWEALKRLFTEDCAFVEHRPIGGEGGRGIGELLRILEHAAGLTSDWTAVLDLLDSEDDGVFSARQTITGTWLEGGAFEIEMDMVMALHDDLISRVEVFGLEQRHVLGARLAELRSLTRAATQRP